VPYPPQPPHDQRVFLLSNDIELTLMLRRKTKPYREKLLPLGIPGGGLPWLIRYNGAQREDARTIDKGVVSR